LVRNVGLYRSTAAKKAIKHKNCAFFLSAGHFVAVVGDAAASRGAFCRQPLS
jgi:hypothetical protein